MFVQALNSLQNHAGGSKWEACTSMFPDGKPPADQNNPTWHPNLASTLHGGTEEASLHGNNDKAMFGSTGIMLSQGSIQNIPGLRRGNPFMDTVYT